MHGMNGEEQRPGNKLANFTGFRCEFGSNGLWSVVQHQSPSLSNRACAD